MRENATQVEAIRILLDRPKDWSTEPLTELRQRLARAPQPFNEKSLQSAHELHYHKALVDIISMVKHAAREDAPLLTAEERVNRALMKVTGRPEDSRPSKDGSSASGSIWSRTSPSTEPTSTRPDLQPYGGWGGPTESSTGNCRIFSNNSMRLSLHD